MNFLYDAPMATILVGPDKKKFVIHQALLCSKSQYFTKALTGSFEEGQTSTVILEDVSAVLFHVFVSWLYNGKIIYTASDERSNIKQDFGSLECSVGESERWKYNHEDPSTWSTHVLVELYIFADRLDIKGLRTDIIDVLKDSVDSSTYSLYTPAFNYINSNTSATSPLRRFVVDQLAYDANHSPANASFWRALPQDMTVEVLIVLGQRVPHRLCSSCYRKGLSWNNVRYNPFQQQPQDAPSQDAPSYQVDLCLYHEHADEEEKQTCRARRSKAVVE